MAERHKQTEESSSVDRELRHSSCDMDLPRTTMIGLAWNDWIKVREIYNESRIESNKRRKAEKKVAELTRELHILENERQPLVSERVLQLQSELQRIEHEREEVNRENGSLKNKLDEVTSKLLAEQELLSNQLDPLLKSKPIELLKVFQQLTTDLIKKAPDTVELAERLMSELSKKMVSHPELHVDDLIKMMQLNANVLRSQPWHHLDDGSKMKLTSGIETMMTSVAERLVQHPDLSSNELIQVTQENTKVLQQIPWYDLDDGSKMNLTSGIETMMTSVADRLVNHSDLSSNELIQVMQEYTKVLEKLPWKNISDGVKNKLMSDLESTIKLVIQHLSKRPEISNDVFKGIVCISEAILKQISWTDLNSDLQNYVLLCLAELMKLVSQRAGDDHDAREVLTDAVSIILAMSSILPQSSDITSRLQSNLDDIVDSVKRIRPLPYDMNGVIDMMGVALIKLKAGNKLSSEATLVILSMASRITTTYLEQETSKLYGRGYKTILMEQLMLFLRDVRRLLPENLPTASDVTELKSQVDSHVATLDRVLLRFNDIQVKSKESDQSFILDEVVRDIKEELSKLKKELANMIHIVERKTKHGLEFKESIQALVERLEVQQGTQTPAEKMRPRKERLMRARRSSAVLKSSEGERMGIEGPYGMSETSGPSETKSKEKMTKVLPSETSAMMAKKMTFDTSETMLEKTMTAGPSETKSKEKMTTVTPPPPERRSKLSDCQLM